MVMMTKVMTMMLMTFKAPTKKLYLNLTKKILAILFGEG